MQQHGVVMIHHLQSESREREQRTGEKQRLQGNMVNNKSGCDIHARGMEKERGRERGREREMCLALSPVV